MTLAIAIVHDPWSQKYIMNDFFSKHLYIQNYIAELIIDKNFGILEYYI